MTAEPQSVATETPLDITDLEIRYPGRREPSLRGIGLEVSAGERVAVAGRTGAGKSTLALAAAGFIPRVVRATVNGAVTIAGVDARTADAGQLLGRVGIVFATPANQLSSSKLTVREELAFGLENLGVPRADMDARIDAVLERLRIGDLAEREPFSLSGGEQQRVAIASIIAMGTDILVLDEPTAQLDPAGTTSVADLIDGLARSGTTILCAEHAPTVLGRADRCLVLDDGRPVSLDRPGAALSAAGREVGLRPPTLVSLANVAGVAPGLEFDEAAIAAASSRQAAHPGDGRRPAGDRASVEPGLGAAARSGRRRGPGPPVPQRDRGRPGRVALDRAGRGGRHPRPERLGQDDARQAPQRAPAARCRAGPPRRRGDRGGDRRPARGDRRVRLPEPRRAAVRAVRRAGGRVRPEEPAPARRTRSPASSRAASRRWA